MQLELRRGSQDGVCTIGDLYVDGVWECYVLENPVRAVKIDHHTAIPAGEYRVDVTFSPRFGRDLPLLEDVPNFDGVRIHPGNTAQDTAGCLLPGATRSTDFVGNSRVAFEVLFDLITAAIDAGEGVSIRIIDPVPGVTA